MIILVTPYWLRFESTQQVHPPFKFKTVTASIIPSLGSWAWFVALVLQDAYFDISIHLVHKLRFQVGGSHYRVLLFQQHQRIFKECLVVAHLRWQESQIYLYLEDWIIRGRSLQQVIDSSPNPTCFDYTASQDQQREGITVADPENRVHGAVLDSTSTRERFRTVVDLINQGQT